MGGPRHFFVSWFQFFLAFFLIVAGSVWLHHRDSNLPPPGEYAVTTVIKSTGPSIEWYKVFFKEGGERKTLKISPPKIKVETLEGLRRATISVDRDKVSLNLPTNFRIKQENILFSVTFAALLFSFVSVMVYLFLTSY